MSSRPNVGTAITLRSLPAWVFEPDGGSEEDAARDIQERYSAVIKVIEAYLTRR